MSKGYTIQKDNKTYRVTKSGKLDKRYKTSRNSTILKKKVSKPMKQSFNWWRYIALVLALALAMIFIIRITEIRMEMLKANPQLIAPFISYDTTYEPVFMENPNYWKGVASWYGESPEHCVGCRADLLMANGQRYNENARTVAFNRLPLGSMVKVTNLANGESVEAEVTDTGGFESLGRIIDLSKGVKELLNCTDLCEVSVAEIS